MKKYIFNAHNALKTSSSAQTASEHIIIKYKYKFLIYFETLRNKMKNKNLKCCKASRKLSLVVMDTDYINVFLK